MKKWQVIFLILGGLATLCLLGAAAVIVFGFVSPVATTTTEAIEYTFVQPTIEIPLPPPHTAAATNTMGATVTPLPTSSIPTYTLFPTNTSIPSLTPIIPGAVISDTFRLQTDCIPKQIPVTGVVSKVLDAENIEVLVNGFLFQVHYIGVKSPIQSQLQDRAVLLNRTMVFGQTVALYRDFSEKDADGRLLRYVLVNNRFVNGEMIVRGMAQTLNIPPDISCSFYFDSLQDSAQKDRKGIWKLPQATINPQGLGLATPEGS